VRGDEYVRFGLVENEASNQAGGSGIKKVLKLEGSEE
jgi:hypothetical protein